MTPAQQALWSGVYAAVLAALSHEARVQQGNLGASGDPWARLRIRAVTEADEAVALARKRFGV